MIECPHCQKMNLCLVGEDLPWDVEHYFCIQCGSTYTVEQVEEMANV